MATTSEVIIKSLILEKKLNNCYSTFTLSLANVCDRCRFFRDGDGRHPLATPWMHVVKSRHANPTDFELISQIKTLTSETWANYIIFFMSIQEKSLIKNENKAKKNFFLNIFRFFNLIISSSRQLFVLYFLCTLKCFNVFHGENSCGHKKCHKQNVETL